MLSLAGNNVSVVTEHSPKRGIYSFLKARLRAFCTVAGFFICSMQGSRSVNSKYGQIVDISLCKVQQQGVSPSFREQLVKPTADMIKMGF